MEGGIFIGGDFVKKSLCFLSCFLVLALFSVVAVFSVSAESSTFSNNLLTYDEYYIGSSNSGTNISVVFSGSSKVFVLKRSSSASLAFLNLVNSTGNSIFKNNTSYPARFSFFLNTYNGKDQTNSSNYLYLTVMFNRKFSAGVNLLGRDSQVSKWEIYYDIPANSSITIDSIQVNCYCNSTSFSTLEFWCKSPTLTYLTDAEYLSNSINSLPQYQDNFNGSYDVGGNALNGAEQNNMNAAADGLNGAKGFFNGMLSNISAYGNAFSVISLLMSKLFTNVPPLYSIVNFSVALGLFGLLLNVVLGVVHRQQREDRIRADRVSRHSSRKGGSS